MKKIYITPATDVVTLGATNNMLVGSALNPEDTNPSTTVSNVEYNDVFSTQEEKYWNDSFEW